MQFGPQIDKICADDSDDLSGICENLRESVDRSSAFASGRRRRVATKKLSTRNPDRSGHKKRKRSSVLAPFEPFRGQSSLRAQFTRRGGRAPVQATESNGADANGNALYVRLKKVTYPSGREIHYVYEAPPTSRLSSISENSGGTQNLVSYTYLGMNTIVTESHPQVSGGLNLSYDYDSDGTCAGWDRFGRIVQQLWKNDAGTTVDGYTYTYNRAGDRITRGNSLNSAFSETYSYDDLNRLVDANRNGSDLQSWGLDALGNWGSFADGASSQTRTANAANEVTGISGSWTDPTYDVAGNMTSGPEAGNETVRQFYVYDAWNRLVAVKADNNGQPGSTVATYQYDGRGYRTQKVIAGGDTFDYYYNDSNQVIEVRKNGSANAYEQYVWDQRYIDAPVIVYRDTDTDGSNVQSVFVTQDANFNVTGIVNGATGAVINRFVFTSYGYRTVYTATWTAGQTDFSLGHQGLFLDAESGLYYNRARYLHTSLGVFTIRDPLGYVDGATLYGYERGKPPQYLDPTGTTGVGHEDPPTPPSSISKCRFRFNIGFPIPHMRLTIDVGSDVWYTIDGQGPWGVGVTVIGHGDGQQLPITGEWFDVDLKVCRCLLGMDGDDTIAKLNEGLGGLGYNPIGANSNFALGCALGACSGGKLDWGKAPTGWPSSMSQCPGGKCSTRDSK